MLSISDKKCSTDILIFEARIFFFWPKCINSPSHLTLLNLPLLAHGVIRIDLILSMVLSLVNIMISQEKTFQNFVRYKAVFVLRYPQCFLPASHVSLLGLFPRSHYTLTFGDCLLFSVQLERAFSYLITSVFSQLSSDENRANILLISIS